ncbi:translesion DNA synthesis-associated protein ImuA [Undibacterium sp. 5I1]|uniref:translesion DNA synthesis-associated protein ImuA n=1 Tax=unclassified Undibacterium TaxID=2630295 RepID=UPI002AB4E609|nr:MULTISPECIES: translesion DNA synthesis-associated protein ImuA [unclassified Undibacterium]MDY7537864.1 translesion DNA synthesis-associated protein ImuA [Undibacterium sp. 5I1]MEB0232320.1 translesion DNA synthesis-associated protein ImuA [Undibacterium sp. 10I3]MEB0259111.1 translesion DNA synthesis-associated protein ImuA [Undibacterium sp. 5I1]
MSQANPSIEQQARLSPLSFPDVWRANEMAVCRASTLTTGFEILDHELPNAGWPRSNLIELLLQQSGIGEMQLLKPILAKLSQSQKIALIQPPYLPQRMACQSWGIDTSRLFWIKAKSTADALWSTEQILKNGSYGAVILWQTNCRAESLRRLNLAAQTTDTWFWLMRPISSAREASPSPLRIALSPATGGVALNLIKRRGPQSEQALFIPLADMPTPKQTLDNNHAVLVKPTFSATTIRDPSSILV